MKKEKIKISITLLITGVIGMVLSKILKDKDNYYYNNVVSNGF